MKEKYRPKRGLFKGRGFLNLTKELILAPRNLNDPNGFYRMFGVEPWASEDEIRRAYRRMARRVHPDGTHPDKERFLYLAEAYHVLTEHREEYNSIPEGCMWRMSGWEGEAGEEVPPSPSPKVEKADKWGYYYTDGENHDLAQEWYEALRETLMDWDYSGRVVVKLGSRLHVGPRSVEVPYQSPEPAMVFVVATNMMSAKIRAGA